MKKYNKQDIIHVLKGSAFLGAGGGGSYEYGMKLLTQLENMSVTIQEHTMITVVLMCIPFTTQRVL